MDDANLLALDPRLETLPRRVVQKIAIIALPIPASATARATRRLPRCGAVRAARRVPGVPGPPSGFRGTPGLRTPCEPKGSTPGGGGSVGAAVGFRARLPKLRHRNILSKASSWAARLSGGCHGPCDRAQGCLNQTTETSAQTRHEPNRDPTETPQRTHTDHTRTPARSPQKTTQLI